MLGAGVPRISLIPGRDNASYDSRHSARQCDTVLRANETMTTRSICRMIGAPLSLAETRHTGGEGTDFGAPGKKPGQKYQKTTTRHTGRQGIDLGHQVMIGVLALSFDLFSILKKYCEQR